MKKTEALENFSRLQREVHILASQYTRMHLPGAPRPLEGRPIARTGGTNEPALAEQQHLNMLADSLRRAEKRYEEACRILNELLAQITDPDLKTMVVLYYAMGYTDQQIAEELLISTRTVNRRRRQYMQSLEGSVS